MIKEILILIVLLCSLPVGWIIAWLARDELISGRKWFRLVILLSFVLGIAGYMLNNGEVMASSLFLFVIGFISYVKSFDRRWTKRINL